MKTVFYPGSFNPFTRGHADIVERLAALAGHVIIGVGVNISKPASAEQGERNAGEIRQYIRRRGLEERVEVTTYSGLTAEKARELGADCMARGVRSAADFDYEWQLAAINRDAFGIETLLLPADPALSFVSSSAVRELEANGAEEIAARYRASRI